MTHTFYFHSHSCAFVILHRSEELIQSISANRYTMNYYLSADYIYRQSRQRSWDQRNDPIMVGDLPLKREDYLRSVLNSARAGAGASSPNNWRRGWEIENEARTLQNLQVLLHLEGQEECEIVLAGGSDGWYGAEQSLFHEEIRGNWDQFARVVGEKDELEDFEISNIVLPPTPFFADKMAPRPSLEKSSLMRLDLINCNLTSSDFQSVAQLLKKVPGLISLGLSRNEIGTIADAKVLSAAMTKHKMLSFVDLRECGLNKSDDILSLLLKGSRKLNGLDLDGNAFGTNSLALIAKFLSSH